MARMEAADKKWRAEADLGTLMEAKKIVKDKARMAAVKRLAKEKKAMLDAITEKRG